MSRDWSGFLRLEFLNTSVVFIHSIPEWPFCFSNVLVATFVAIYNVNYIAQFTGEFVFWGQILAFEYLFAMKTGNLINLFDLWTVGAFAQSCADWDKWDWFASGEGFGWI